MLSRIKPINVVFGLPTSKAPQSDSAGRELRLLVVLRALLTIRHTGIVTLEFENSYVVGTCEQHAMFEARRSALATSRNR